MPFSHTVEVALFLALSLALVVTALVQERWFLFLLGFVLPLMVPRIDVGIGLDWYKIVGPIAVALGVVRRVRGVGLRRTGANAIYWYIGYAVLVTTVWIVLEMNWLQRYRLAAALEMGAGPAQYKYKMPVQLGSVVGQLLLVLAVPLWARSLRDVRWAVLGVLSGCATSVGAGLLSLLFFGQGSVNALGLQGIVTTSDSTIARLGGLSGEPKFLGASLTIVFAHALATQLFSRATARSLLLTVASLVVLFVTYSTSAWAGAAAVGATAMLLSLRNPTGSRTAVFLLLVGAAVVVTSSVGFIATMLDARFVERVFGETGDLAQQKDMYVFQAFADGPFNAIFGFGLGGGDLAVIPYVEWLHIKYSRTPTAGVTGVRLLGDLGIFGMLLLVGTVTRWSRRLKRQGSPGAAAFLMLGLAAVMFTSLIALSLYLFLVGAALAAAELGEEAEREEPAVATVGGLPLPISEVGR